MYELNSKFSDLRMSKINEINKQIKEKEAQLKQTQDDIDALENNLSNN